MSPPAKGMPAFAVRHRLLDWACALVVLVMRVALLGFGVGTSVILVRELAREVVR